MRMMLRWTVPADAGNSAIRTGGMSKVINHLLEELRPEAAYFWPENGKRGGMMVFDMPDPSQIPRVAEPLFVELNAEVSFTPVMNRDELRSGTEGSV